MRLDQVELRHVRMRLQTPFETSFGVEVDRDCLILRAECEGLIGWGECVAGQIPGYCYETVGTAWHVLSDFFLPALLGQEIEGVDDLNARLGPFKGHPLARAGIEMAFWDLMGKREAKPVSALLGGIRERVPVGVSVGIQPDLKTLLQVVDEYLEAGYRRIKLKIKPGRDLEELRAVRNAYPDLMLQADANSAYSLQDTDTFLEADSLRLAMIEQPLAEDDLIDHSVLQAALETPICLDESIPSARHARQAIELGACRIINIKQARVGGLAEALAVHDTCRELGVPVWCGGMLETGIGRAANLGLASLPGFVLPGDISASERYYAQDIAEPLFQLNADSTLDVPTSAGLGVQVNTDILGGVTLRREVFSP
ncbi:MAG: o-succinylbenzoate synthase [Anaerolineales bacterium]|jgi:O-succinylbenzoate synthase